jgi:uncharacterized protein (TIGR02001 family)
MKKLTTNLKLAAALTLAMATLGTAHAQDAKVEATPDNVISYNVGVVSDYRFRGLSQSRLDPALQGGVDYTHTPSGFYAGTWLSTIKWTKDAPGGGGDVEVDLYGGKRGEIVKDVSYDVGGLYYIYPKNGLETSANTFELYGQVGFGPAYIKYSHALTDTFGTADSKNSGYVDVGVNYDVYDGYMLNLHAGHQNIKNNGDFSYNDYKIGVTKDFGIVTVSLAAIKADTSAYVSPTGKNLGKTGAILTVSKTF